MKTQSGFTLLEVLIALLILGLTLTASLKVISENTRHFSIVRDRTMAHWSAANALAEVRDAAYDKTHEDHSRIAANGFLDYDYNMLGRDWYVRVDFKQDIRFREEMLIASAAVYHTAEERQLRRDQLLSLNDYIIDPREPAAP